MEYNVGDALHCPVCRSVRAKIIWKSADGKTVGIKCPRSGYRHKKNSVILAKLTKTQGAIIRIAKHHNTTVIYPNLY